MSEITDISEENQRMVNALAENRRLRAALSAAGLPLPPPREHDMAALASAIAELHGLEVSDILSRSRVREIAHARHHFMWAARQVKEGDIPRWSLPQIGRFLGLGHTAVMYGAAEHERRRAEEGRA